MLVKERNGPFCNSKHIEGIGELEANDQQSGVLPITSESGAGGRPGVYEVAPGQGTLHRDMSNRQIALSDLLQTTAIVHLHAAAIILSVGRSALYENPPLMHWPCWLSVLNQRNGMCRYNA